MHSARFPAYLSESCAQVVIHLQMADGRFHHTAASKFFFYRDRHPALLSGFKDTIARLKFVPLITLVDVNPFRFEANLFFASVQYRPEGMAIEGATVQGANVQDKMAARGTIDIGGYGYLAAKLIRFGGLALANTFHLGRMSGVALLRAALLLPIQNAGSLQGLAKVMKPLLIVTNLTANIADHSPQPYTYKLLGLARPPDLFGMPVSARHHHRLFAYPQVTLPQGHPMMFRQRQQDEFVARVDDLIKAGAKQIVGFGRFRLAGLHQ